MLNKPLHFQRIPKLWQFAYRFGPYAPIAILFCIGLITLSLSRFGLVIWKLDRVNATEKLAEILLQGIRVDLIQLSLMALIPILLAPLLATHRFFTVWRRFTYWWVIISFMLLLFLEAATPGFIAEYDVRPNRLFVEYLKYPQEIFGMLWRGFRIHIFATFIVSILSVWWIRRLMRPWLRKPTHAPWKNSKLWLTWPLIFILLTLMIRSSFGHRPANPAMFAISQDSMVNSLILNSAYSVTYATYALQHEAKSSDMYGKLPREQIGAFTGADMQAELPTLTTLHPSQKRSKPLNLVILLQESLGATFVESLGGVPVTPHLEQLKKEGIWFEQLYATGTRSVRGIEAVVTGFQPTPADSTVKLSLSQKNFFTLASLLQKQGYATEFIYGGESHFDNMRSFFLGNGFESIIEQKDYKNPAFVASWGVSDEDLLNKTHERISQYYAKSRPFFALAFTSSNHAPFDFPDGRVELYEQPKATDNNAVKYADYAMGEFFKKAKQSDYWKDTVFLIVADHDIRVRGDKLVPIQHFHIPGLILGADIQPKSISTIASQIDLPVTVLSLMGIETQHPMTGRDLSGEISDKIGRALMQYADNFAWMEGNQVVVLRPEKPPAYAIYAPNSKTLTPISTPENAKTLADRALANSLLTSILYQEKRYRLPQ